MSRHIAILCVVIGTLWAVWIARSVPQVVRAAEPETEAQAAPVAPEVSPAQPAATPEQAAYELETRKYQAELIRREKEQRARAELAEKTPAQRNYLRLSHQPAWAEVISTNWVAFQSLRREAAHSHPPQVPCTLCDGRGRMHYCILCDHSDGKCLTCRGTGKLSSFEVCPTCLGTGKCYLCSGTGKMLCPFCDDGTISANGPLPSKEMPSR